MHKHACTQIHSVKLTHKLQPTQIHTHTYSAPILSALICDLCRGEWQEGRCRGEVSFRCLNYGSSPPYRCHHPQGRARQKEGNVSSLLPWYFKFQGEQEEKDSRLLHWRKKRKSSDAFLFSLFSLLASFAAVFKIRHLNKSSLMASRQEKKAQLDYCDGFI